MKFKKLKYLTGNPNKMKPRGRKRKLAASVILSLRLFFGGPQLDSSNSKTFQSGGNSKTEISRVLEKESFRHQEGSAQPEQVMKSSQTALKIPHGGDGNSSQPSKFTAGSKAKGAAARNMQSRKSKVSGKSPGSTFAEAWLQNPEKRSRTAAANRLAQQLQPGQAEGGNGLFGRFLARPTPDPYNPGT